MITEVKVKTHVSGAYINKVVVLVKYQFLASIQEVTDHTLSFGF